MTIKSLSTVGIAFLLLASGGGIARAQNEVLDNGLVRISFDRHTGLFAAQSLRMPHVYLFDAGPRFEKDGRMVSAANATRIEVRHEAFTDKIGSGQKLVVAYTFGKETPTLRYDLCLYAGKPWVSATGHLAPGNYRLGDFLVIQGRIRAPAAFKTRVYINAGRSGGDSGVWPLGERRWHSAALSVLYDPGIREAICFGFYSFYRASTAINPQYAGPDEIRVQAVAHYHNYRPLGQELRTESLLISFGANPLGLLENWANSAVKVVQPTFNHNTRTGIFATWYVYGNQITQQEVLEQAQLLSHSILSRYYGINIFFTGEWQKQHPGPGDGGDALGFGEDQEDQRLFPNGMKWLCDQIHALGLQSDFGANYAYAAPESSIARKHVPWIVWADRSNISAGHPIDFTDPAAQKWLYDLAHRTVEYDGARWWDDFDGGPTRGPLHDPTKIMGFEDIREGLKTIRRSVGPDVLIDRACCGPYFTYIGLADRVRVGDDSHALGDFEGLKAMARQLAANYMLHQRFWINNPDVLFVGGRSNRDLGTGSIGPDPSMTAEVRMRLQYQLATGGFVRVGENLNDLNQTRLHLLTLVLPPQGQAARPLDLFTHTTPEIYDLHVKTGWDTWHVLLVQNWNDWQKTYQITFSRLGLGKERHYLVFRFWDQHFLGEFRDGVHLNVGARQGETYVIRSVPSHPWVLSTDMHLSQGGVELHDVRYNGRLGQLSGTATRNPGAKGQVVVYAPIGYIVRSASGPYTVQVQPSGARIVYLVLNFQQKSTTWSLRFEKLKAEGALANRVPEPGHTPILGEMHKEPETGRP